MRRLILTILLLLGVKSVIAQEAPPVIFTYDAYYQTVLAHHPLVASARLLPEQAQQNIRFARGAFDPKISVDWTEKVYNDSEYYHIASAALKVPTWLGLEPEIGIRENKGDYLNPQNYISQDNDYAQVFAGTSITIGRGLFIDQRRAILKQSIILEDIAEADKVKEINKVLLNTAKDYWNWYLAYEMFQVMQQSLVIAEDVYKRTVVNYDYGEVAAIDTTQAYANWLYRKNELLDAKIALIQSALQLSVNLWDETGQPLELAENSIPEQPNMFLLSTDALGELIELAGNNHPEMLKINLKSEILSIDRRLARESLKPELTLKYHLLDQPYGLSGDNPLSFNDNYFMNIRFGMPIFLRKERAKVAIQDLKLQENEYQRTYQQRRIITDINTAYINLSNMQQVIVQQSQVVTSYAALVEAERLNISMGESDLFKFNNQMDKWLETQRKLIKLKAQFQKDLVELYWLAGNMVE